MTATATATAPVRTRVVPGRVAPRPTPRSAQTPVRSARPPAALRVVEPPTRRYPGRAVAVVAVLLVFGSMLVSAIFHSVLVTGQARVDDLGRQIAVAEKGLAQDRLELAQMSSPARIAAEAERLGLVVADRQTWIRPGSDDAPVVTGGEVTGSAESTSDRDSTDGGTAAAPDADERALGAVGEEGGR